MKVGSLVELVDDCWKIKHHAITYPVKAIIYTVRDLDPSDDSLLLEEVVNKKCWCTNDQNNLVFAEPGFTIKKFHELQPPIANIEEHINENIDERELVNI